MDPRSTSRSISPDPSSLVVGLIRGPHGLTGEVRVDVRSDVPGRFRAGARLECDGIGTLAIVAVRGEAKSTLVRFSGYDDREAAATLAGRFLRVAREESRRESEGYLWADLVGLRAESQGGEALGTVTEVIRAGEADVLVIHGNAGDLLVPMIGSVVREIDVAAGRIVVVPQEAAG